MEISELRLYNKSLDSYTALDVEELEPMTDNELDDYQYEIENDTGNTSVWDDTRAIISFRKQIYERDLEIKRLRSEIAHLRDSGLHVNAEDTWQALPKVCEAILKGEEWSI